MTSSLSSSVDVQGLASEQRGLLDLIDKLQFAQLDNVKLPQIVVVGDQSAGKSSVLEAISGTPFPREAGACTRFATEIRLRRSKETTLRVSIIPDKNRPYNEQNRLLQFGGNANMSFDSMMREATELIAPRNIPGRFAARDILVVEKTGPDMPLLTLVDLPGLVRVANRDQSDADIQTIEALSERYMKSSRTIILAVIGGNNDYVQAPILQKARQFDPSGSRTIGVLTKPDMTEGIGLEDKFIELVTNKDQENNFKLGWYVLLNPGPGEYWGSPKTALDERPTLRQKLSSQLQRHIGKHVKSLRRQIQQALEQCEAQLKSMGSGHDSVEEMRFQMGELFTASNNLVTPAVNGNYKNPVGERFFARQTAPKGMSAQKLRARVREESERFSRSFRQHGRTYNSAGDSLPAVGVVDDPSKKEFAQREVEPLLRQIRGNELPLDSNPRAPYILFQDFSRNWPVLAQEYKDNVGVICNEFLTDVILHVFPTRMQDPLRFHFLEMKMKNMMENSENELGKLGDDLLLEIQPYDPEYEDRLIKWRAEATQNGGIYTEAEEVLEKSLIYYDLNARIFTRNVITQVVERNLLLGMLGLFNPIEILRMPNSTVEGIAAENKETRDLRITLKARKAAIEEARSICASLAMRSDLRSYQDDDEVDVATDDEDVPKRPSAYEQTQSHQAVHQPTHQPAHQPTRSQDSTQRPQRREAPRPSVITEAAQRTPATTQQEFAANATEWAPYYPTPQQQAAPTAVPPPPPPRPSKVGYEEAERYYEAPRPDSSRGKESARHRLASVMKMGQGQT
ncbi:Interferon-induced GTP-binding protein Mx [Cladobotryum mycophilum]|uniref:Interferon-induced GTP-binding protein Mx n=1 Tax=Cladobotryum mycophilum TaxID=491253 RepID=A0ABR0S9G0_9HYPO